MLFTSYIYQDTLKTLDPIWRKLASGGALQMLWLRKRARLIGAKFGGRLRIWVCKLPVINCACMWFLGVRLNPQKHKKGACFSKSLNLIHPGYGVPLKDIPPEKFNSTAMPKSYQSPWEKVGGVDLVFSEPSVPCAPSQPRSDQPAYKSFNR